jgi:hypothetical protein
MVEGQCPVERSSFTTVIRNAVGATSMGELEFDIDGEVLTAELLEEAAPRSVEAFREFLPLESQLMHVRFSGIAT